MSHRPKTHFDRISAHLYQQYAERQDRRAPVVTMMAGGHHGQFGAVHSTVSDIQQTPTVPGQLEKATGFLIAGLNTQQTQLAVATMVESAIDRVAAARSPEGRAKAEYLAQADVYAQAGISEEQFVKHFLHQVELGHESLEHVPAAAAPHDAVLDAEYEQHRELYASVGIDKATYIQSRRKELGVYNAGPTASTSPQESSSPAGVTDAHLSAEYALHRSEVYQPNGITEEQYIKHRQRELSLA